MSKSFNVSYRTLSDLLGFGLTDDLARVSQPLTSVGIHSRRLRENSIFVAIQGPIHDGHDYIEHALESGAKVVICETCPPALVGDQRIIEVPSSSDALLAIAEHWREQLQCRFILTIGTHGKTIAKTAISKMLVGCRAGTVARNDPIGVALSILDVTRRTRRWVGEAVISAPGDADKFARVVRPDVVVIPNLSTQWTARFTSRQEELNEYRRLLSGDDVSRILSSDASKALSLDSSPIELPDLQLDFVDHRFVLSGPSIRLSVNTSSLEVAQDVALATQAALMEVRTDPYARLADIQEFDPPESRLQQWRTPRGIVVIKDQRTTDPVALAPAFDTLDRSRIRAQGSNSGKGSAIFVLPVNPPLGTDGLNQFTDACRSHSAPPDTILVKEGAEARQLRERLAPEIEIVEVGSTEAARNWLEKNARYGDAVLVQGSGVESITELVAMLFSTMAPNRMYIDLDAVEANILAFRKACPGVELVAMVKALAYGTDPINLALALEGRGVDALAVSSVDEGISLRQAGVGGQILVMLPLPEAMDDVLDMDLTPVVYSWELLERCVNLALEGRCVLIHLEFDTGMHRTGFPIEDAERVLRLVYATSNLTCSGIMTHLACADDSKQDNFTREQLDKFNRLRRLADAIGLVKVKYHASATAGAIRFPEARHDMIRIGLGLYGIYPSRDCEEKGISLTHVVRLQSRIVETVNVAPGESVGYGATFVAKEPMAIGVIPAGYHDCLPRALSKGERGYVEVAGQRARIVGRISMDSAMIDITEIQGAGVGTEVSIYGPVAKIEDAAAVCDTIPYELLARVGPRVQRILVANSHPLR